MKDKKFTALGCHIYAGGFSLGVKQAGFQLLGHLEEWPFGVATAKHNLQIPIWQGLETWNDATTKLSGKVNLFYGNPPCASWSIAGVKKGVLEIDRWKDHELTDCTQRFFLLIPRLKPQVFVWECVANVAIKGSVFLEERTKEVLSQGYHVYHIVFDAMNCGLPQRRRRFFFVASKIALKIIAPHHKLITVGEVLKKIYDPGPVLKTPERLIKILKQMPLNKEIKLYKQFDLDNPNPLRNERGQCIGRPGFLNHRLCFDKVAPTITGGPEFFHPVELRRLSVIEQQALCGYPLDYKFIGPIQEQYAQVGKGVTPTAAYWLMVQIMVSLKMAKKITPGLTIHDFIKKENVNETKD
jgi:site-specific DNA-cytosine methylase